MQRTGTTSVQMALGYLGLNAYHGRSLWWHPEHTNHWLALLNRRRFNKKRTEFLDQFDAIAGDFPAFPLWRQLCAQWPDAKVLLTVRDPEEWVESFQETIVTRYLDGPVDKALPSENLRGLAYALMWGPGAVFSDHSREGLLRAFEAHNREVQETIPRDRLLVMDVKDGWGRLAEHVGMETPDLPFPALYARNEFHTTETTYWQLWVKGEASMSGVGWGKNLEEACMDYASRNPEWAADFDRDRLLHGGQLITSERPS